MKIRFRPFLFLLMLWVGPFNSNPVHSSEDNEFQKFIRQYNDDTLQKLSLYDTTPRGKKPKLQLRKKAILNWSNARNGYFGAQIHLWLKDERPAALSGILHWPKQGMTVWEFINLSSQNVLAEHDGDVVWEDKSVGFVMKPLPNTAAPVKSKNLRLTQMRRIAAEFKVRAIKGPPDYPADSEWKLRLVPEPLYRYQPKKGDVIDGAIFSFAIETDPEAILLLEFRRDKDGRHKWHYGFARACAWKLIAERNKKSVWTTDRIMYPLPNGYYFFQVPQNTVYPISTSNESFETAKDGLPIEY